jgi:hypothetical protein
MSGMESSGRSLRHWGHPLEVDFGIPVSESLFLFPGIRCKQLDPPAPWCTAVTRGPKQWAHLIMIRNYQNYELSKYFLFISKLPQLF